MRYDLDGNEIRHVVKCKNCGHGVDAAPLFGIGNVNGLGYVNDLMVIDNRAECCPHPDYNYLSLMEGV